MAGLDGLLEGCNFLDSVEAGKPANQTVAETSEVANLLGKKAGKKKQAKKVKREPSPNQLTMTEYVRSQRGRKPGEIDDLQRDSDVVVESDSDISQSTLLAIYHCVSFNRANNLSLI